jgi:hypothetical protein
MSFAAKALMDGYVASLPLPLAHSTCWHPGSTIATLPRPPARPPARPLARSLQPQLRLLHRHAPRRRLWSLPSTALTYARPSSWYISSLTIIFPKRSSSSSSSAIRVSLSFFARVGFRAFSNGVFVCGVATA